MAFLTLFLGLVTGVQTIELTVADLNVARIELLLDGRTIGIMTGAPWTLTADLGDLAPHELEAVGFDSEGREIVEARQWINMPRDRAEAELILEGDREGQVDSARLVWSSVDAARPKTARVFLDGAELEDIDPKGFPVPPYDVSIPHLLQAEVQLGDTVARAQAVVGGGSGSAVSQDLTALPLYLDGGNKLPTPAEAQGWIEARGQPIRVVAVERSGVDVIMVQDLAWYLQRRLKGLRNEMLETRITARKRPTGLKSRDHFRLLFPIPETAGEAAIRSLHFPMSPNLWTGQPIETHARGAVDRQVADAMPQGLMVGIPVNGERKLDTSNQHLTDAAAVAALAAAQGHRARVLLLVTGSDEEDHSRYSPEQVRSYLARLNVPLRIWSPEPEMVDKAWGDVESIATRNRLERTIRGFREFLDRQIVVWVEGLHLPQQLELTAAAAGRLQRITDVGPPLPEPGEDADLDPGLRVAELPLGQEPAAEETSTRPAPRQAEVGQEPPGQAVAPPATSVQEPSLGEVASFEEAVEVNVVNVDVVVTDQDGNRVRGLTREDFRLYEDGEPVEVSFFQAPPPARPRDGDPSAATDSEPEAPGRPMNLIVYLDLFQLNKMQRTQALQALEANLADQREAVRVMIVTNDGSVDIPLPFTEDPEAIRGAIQEISSRKARIFRDESNDAFDEMARVKNAITDAHGLRDEASQRSALRAAFAQRRAVEGMIQRIAEEKRREVNNLIDSLGRFALASSGVEGRRAILYLGDRLNISPGEALYTEAAGLMADPSLLGSQVDNVSEGTRQMKLQTEGLRFNLSTELTSMIRETSAVGVTFYTLTPPNLANSDMTRRSSVGTPGSAGRLASTRNESTKAAACGLSGDTGGLCQVGGTEMTRLLKETYDDFGAFYSLAFTPDREPGDATTATYRRIKVEVDQPGLQVRYREGYLDRPREDTVKDRLIAALTFGEEQDDLSVQLAMQPPQATDKAGLFLIPFEVRVSAQSLALLPVAGEKRQANARLMITTMDHKGQTTGIQEYPIRFEVSERRLGTGQPLLYAHKVHLTLAKGEQTLAVGLWDNVGRVGSFMSRKLEIGG